MFNSASRFFIVAAASMALSIGHAYAQEEDAPASQGQQSPLNMRQLHDQLSLNPNQEVQWQAALDALRQSHDTERMSADQMQLQLQSLLQQPVLDLAAIHAAHLKVEQQDAQLREQSATAWITFYSGLTDQQKTIVSTALKPQFAAIGRHPARPFDPRTGL